MKGESWIWVPVHAVVAVLTISYLFYIDQPDWLSIVDAAFAAWNCWMMVMWFRWWLQDELDRVRWEIALHNEEIAYRHMFERLCRLYGVGR